MGDSSVATPQLLDGGELDYIVYDYLAEVTLSIMARARAKDANMGYATDFISSALKHNLPAIAKQGVKVISNAGGVNPKACGEAARVLIAEMGLDLTVAVVTGDDLLDANDLDLSNSKEMFSGEAFPKAESVVSINAYLGAFPIAQALAEGADIVITGRSVDSAVTLAACIYEFGWQPNDWDQLSSGTLAGHIIECGTQATGGNFTDWQQVVDSLDRAGYPIAEVKVDGSFDIVKPANTGGMVSVGTVSEQMLYEIGDPQAYLMPDVVCDFSQVLISQLAEDRVNVSGAIGYPATDSYKVSATYADGWRGGSLYNFCGIDADKKAEAFAELVLKRVRSVFQARQMEDFKEVSIEVMGAETHYGDFQQLESSREVVLKLAARHADAKAIAILLKEVTGLALSAPPGLSIFAGARPKPSPVVRLFSFLIPKHKLSIQIDNGQELTEFQPLSIEHSAKKKIQIKPVPAVDCQDLKGMAVVPLVTLAWARSGDKGDKANIGVIARQPEFLPYIIQSLTVDSVAKRFAHFMEKGGSEEPVECFLLPGSNAINFLIHHVLGGGGMASLRSDAQGKAYAQILLDHPIVIPEQLLDPSAETLK
ncbi:acyclic terpene utilization AtuA family protein [Oceanicoccus sagamiensis]|uniref:acyclic terpene utilization AtuA family protein n=1 Tax=Oceanicoccus sagamiensis TaxID=716816 RepID=UPI001F0A97B1|nr:acyclic terpene utilization AtuA family protein [Oceanicoccus sagamiensis]